jgi:hypothetical protein
LDRNHWYSRFVAFATLLLLMSGAAVTSSRDQPRQAALQNVHMVAAGVEAVLLVALAIRVRRMGWIALAIFIADAGLGEMRRHGGSDPIAGTGHAFLAALLFTAVSVIAMSPESDPELVQDYGWPSLRFLSAAAAFLVGLQVGFGAGFRHSAVGVMPHLLGALVVALFIIIVGVFVSNQFRDHKLLRPMATAFMTVTGIQVFLGMTAFLMRLMMMGATSLFLAVSVAHVAMGSFTLAVGVLLALEIRRSVLQKNPRTDVTGL